MEKRMPSRRKSRATKRRTFDVINPATGKALASYPIATAPQVRAKVEAAREAFRSWSRLDPKERAAFLQPELVATDAMRSYIAFHPRGVLGSIMPWNFPMWQIVRFAVPALIAGNTVVVKPASATPQSGCNL